MEIHSFIQQIFVGHLLLTRHYSRHWWYSYLKKTGWRIGLGIPIVVERPGNHFLLRCKKHSAVLCLVTQSCPTLCDPMDWSPPGSSVPGDSPGKNIGVGCHALLQGIFPTQGSNPGFPHCRRILYHLSHQSKYRELWEHTGRASDLTPVVG